MRQSPAKAAQAATAGCPRTPNFTDAYPYLREMAKPDQWRTRSGGQCSV